MLLMLAFDVVSFEMLLICSRCRLVHVIRAQGLQHMKGVRCALKQARRRLGIRAPRPGDRRRVPRDPPFLVLDLASDRTNAPDRAFFEVLHYEFLAILQHVPTANKTI